MNYLLDTHTLIWLGEDDPRLPVRIRELIEHESNVIWVSYATFWEITIKMSLGKLHLRWSLQEWEQLLAEGGILMLPTSFTHFEALLSLPMHHQDPFDRLLIAQALAEDFAIITHDAKFADYPAQLVHF